MTSNTEQDLQLDTTPGRRPRVVCNAPCALAARSGVVGLGGMSPVPVSFGSLAREELGQRYSRSW
jgi:hypothetical protein